MHIYLHITGDISNATNKTILLITNQIKKTGYKHLLTHITMFDKNIIRKYHSHTIIFIQNL